MWTVFSSKFWTKHAIKVISKIFLILPIIGTKSAKCIWMSENHCLTPGVNLTFSDSVVIDKTITGSEQILFHIKISCFLRRLSRASDKRKTVWSSNFSKFFSDRSKRSRTLWAAVRLWRSKYQLSEFDLGARSANWVTNS